MAKTGKDQVGASKITTVEASQQSHSCEEMCDPNATRPYVRSKELISSFDARLSQAEGLMNGMEAQVVDLGERVSNLEEENTIIHDSMRSMIIKLEEAIMAKMARMHDNLMREIDNLWQAYEELHKDVTLCKRALTAMPTNHLAKVKRIEAPKPKSFGGSHNSKEVDNFVWGLEQYFTAMGISKEETKVQIATRHLTDTIMLWWRRRRDIKRGLCTLSSFHDFNKELKKQFYLENADDEARAKLRRLKQDGAIQEYIREFTSLVLEILDMSDKDSIFYFMDELQ